MTRDQNWQIHWRKWLHCNQHLVFLELSRHKVKCACEIVSHCRRSLFLFLWREIPSGVLPIRVTLPPHTPPPPSLPSSTFRYASRITYLPEIVTTRTICPAYDQNTLTRPALEPWLTEFHRPEHKATGSLHRLEFNRWSKKNSDIDEFYFCSYLQVFFYISLCKYFLRRFVLRNYIAHKAIEAAENGDFALVRAVNQ